MMSPSQHDIDIQNAEFWNELCGSGLARSLGITEPSPQNLLRFDEAYFGIYHYLYDYTRPYALAHKKTLEIGLGYGTLGQHLVEQGAEYYGLDIATSPTKMMRYRLTLMNKAKNTLTGSALAIPYHSDSFDFVYTIGCLHHTGNLSLAVAEVYRVLKPGGHAIVMLYNRHSFRQLVQVLIERWRTQWKTRGRWSFAEKVRALYDTNAAGQAAPHTDYVSPAEARQIFEKFTDIQIDVRNFDAYYLPITRWYIPREKLLDNVGRILGLDLYIRAQK